MSQYLDLAAVLDNPVAIRVFWQDVSQTSHDLYTCPSSKRAILFGYSLYNGTASANITGTLRIKVSGTYYEYNTTAWNALASGSSGSGNRSIMLQAGDILNANISSMSAAQNGGNLTCMVVEFDDTSPLVNWRVTSPVSGWNTCYTCPASKTAALVSVLNGFVVGNQASESFWSDSTFRNVYWGLAPSGTPNQLTQTAALVSGAINAPGNLGTLAAGDFLSLHVDANTSGAFAHGFVLEMPT